MFKKEKKEHLYNKKTVIIFEILFALVVLAAAIGIKYLVTNKNDSTLRFENQVVEGITFSDFNISFNKEGSTVKVNLINYTEESIELEGVVIKLYAKDNTQVSEITLDSGFASLLESNQSIQVENTTTADLSGISSVEYVVTLKQ